MHHSGAVTAHAVGSRAVSVPVAVDHTGMVLVRIARACGGCPSIRIGRAVVIGIARASSSTRSTGVSQALIVGIARACGGPGGPGVSQALVVGIAPPAAAAPAG